MTVDIKDVEKIAKLARIGLPEDEHAGVAQDLQKVLGWIEQLSQIDTEQIQPADRVHPDFKARLRADVVTGGNIADKILENAPVREGDFFAVPKVVE